MRIEEIWMRLESLAHLRELGPKYKALHDRLAWEVEEESARIERPAPPPATAPSPSNIPPAQQEEADVRRQAAQASLAATSGRPAPAVGQFDKTDEEAAAETHTERRI